MDNWLQMTITDLAEEEYMSGYDFWNFKLKDTMSHSFSIVVWGQAPETQLTSYKLQVHQILNFRDYVLQRPRFTQSCGELLILDLEFYSSCQPRKLHTVNGSVRWLASFYVLAISVLAG